MTHSLDFAFSQLVMAASRAASCVVRQAAPMCLRSSVVARAEHCFAALSMTTLQPLVPHSLSATVRAFAAVDWSQLQAATAAALDASNNSP
jgi:hypothetical protein